MNSDIQTEIFQEIRQRIDKQTMNMINDAAYRHAYHAILPDLQTREEPPIVFHRYTDVTIIPYV